MFKYDVKIVVFLVSTALFFYEAAPDWCFWLMEGKIGVCLRYAYNFLASHILFNCLCAIAVVLSGGYCLWRILRDRDIRVYRLALLVLYYVLLYVNNILLFVPLTSVFDYRDLCGILLALAFLAMVIKIIDRRYPCMNYVGSRIKDVQAWIKDITVRCKSTDSNNEKAGFPVDGTKSIKVPDALDKYADEIVSQLLQTDLSEQSFAVGITGEWGTGKTVFLNLLCSKLEGKAEIVSFNPWLCRTPEQVTDDFFGALEKQLSPRHSSLSKPLRDYAHDITNVADDGWLSKFTPFFPKESLQSKKKRLSNCFSKLDKPVVVIVDDIDRMESEEVFEVLRLIRNTADLKNTIYIAAYDRTYVTNVLESAHIMNSEAYLQKIFPVELHQPKVEDNQIMLVLFEDLKSIRFADNFVPVLKSRINNVQQELVARILGNYRQARRFARQYILNASYIQTTFTNELSLLDLFWLELLQVYDKKVYDILKTDPDMLLDNHEDHYVLRSGITDSYPYKDIKKFEGAPFWREKTPEILYQLFGWSVKKSKIGIRYTENYDKFFTLGVPAYRLSRREFLEVFKHKGEEERIVKKWLTDGKYIRSIFHHIEHYEKSNNDDNLKSYINCILSFGFVMFRDYKNSGIGRRLRDVLKKAQYNKEQCEKGNQIIKDWFDNRICQHSDHVAITKLLNELYQTKVYDEKGHEEGVAELLIKNDEIEHYLQIAMADFLTNNPDVTAKNLFEEKTDMGKVFNNCCIQTEEMIINDWHNKWKNVTIDTVIKHFVDKPKIPMADKAQILEGMFKIDYLNWDDDPDADERYDYEIERRDMQLNAYFGSDNNDYDRLINALFVEGDK